MIAPTGFRSMVRIAYREERLSRAQWLRSLPWPARWELYQAERRLAGVMREGLDAGQAEIDLAIMDGALPLAESVASR